LRGTDAQLPPTQTDSHASSPPPAGTERHLLISAELPSELRLSELALSARSGRQHPGEAPAHAAHVPAHSEPSVQVTIGRIEVRATKESMRPVKTLSSARAMSLEDYLRERARRGGQ
jgi:hypothetical protein